MLIARQQPLWYFTGALPPWEAGHHWLRSNSHASVLVYFLKHRIPVFIGILLRHTILLARPAGFAVLRPGRPAR
jgi:hypothetical protein